MRYYQVHDYLGKIQEVYGDNLFLNPDIVKKLRFIKNEDSDSYNLSNLKNNVSGCLKCPLGLARNKIVFGIGDPKADLMLVGEAPGEKEDETGEPFVGKAGALLDKILLSIKLKRTSNVYITNVIKCRPQNNRDPLPSEVEKCQPYLIKQIQLIKPKLIVALGRVAGKTLLKLDISLKEMRGKLHHFHSTPLYITYHPAALLRNPNLKIFAWEDFKYIKNFLEHGD